MASLVENPSIVLPRPAPARLAQALAELARKVWHPLSATEASSGTSATEERTRHVGTQAELVSLVFAFCLAVFVTKLTVAYQVLDNEAMPPRVCTPDWLVSLSRIAACCAEDVAVGLSCLLVAGLISCCRFSKAARWTLRLVVYVCSFAALFLLAINAHLFHEMRTFLTARHIELSGGWNMEKSVANCATSNVRATLVFLPLLTLAAHVALISAFPRFWQHAARALCRPVLLLALIVCLFLFARKVQSSTFFDTPSDFAQNPHLYLASSYFDQLHTQTLVDVADQDLSDFAPGNPRLSHVPLAKRPTNVVLIVLESVSAQYLDVYGGPWPVTPELRKLESRGIVFDNFQATVNYSIASALPLLGSMYNDTKTLSNVVAYPKFPVPFGSTWLKKHGYQTYFLGSGGERCWEGYRNMTEAFVADGQFDVARDKSHPFWQKNPNPIRFWTDDYNDRATFTDAKRVLQEARGDKFFLVVWNYDTHYPYYPEDKTSTFDERKFPPFARLDATRRERFIDYLRSIRDVDALIGDFYAELERLGLAEDTLVIVTGDHGEAWGQHGVTFHGWSLYDEEIRVPLLLLHPSLASLGPRSKVIGSHIDLWPTIVDLCALPADPRWQGRSLFGGADGEERRAYSYGINNMLGLRQGKYRYIWDGKARTDLLFDVDADPGETTNLAADQADLCAEFRRRVFTWANYQRRLTRERLAP